MIFKILQIVRVEDLNMVEIIQDFESSNVFSVVA